MTVSPTATSTRAAGGSGAAASSSNVGSKSRVVPSWWVTPA